LQAIAQGKLCNDGSKLSGQLMNQFEMIAAYGACGTAAHPQYLAFSRPSVFTAGCGDATDNRKPARNASHLHTSLTTTFEVDPAIAG
jgi:hypothetical protein